MQLRMPPVRALAKSPEPVLKPSTNPACCDANGSKHLKKEGSLAWAGPGPIAPLTFGKLFHLACGDASAPAKVALKVMGHGQRLLAQRFQIHRLGVLTDRLQHGLVNMGGRRSVLQRGGGATTLARMQLK
jgi:hypothetical protein